MQPTVNVPDTKVERGGTNHHISWLFKRFGSRVPTLLPALVICLLAPIGHGMSVAQTPTPKPTAPAAQSEAQKAFEKMKTLAGSWQGNFAGMSISITIRLASSRTALLHEATTSGGRPPNHEITMFYLDGDRLLANHYCDAGNRSLMEGKLSPDGQSVEFSLLDLAGGTQRGFLKRIFFGLTDANRHVVEITFIMPDGKPVQVRGEFQRSRDPEQPENLLKN